MNENQIAAYDKKVASQLEILKRKGWIVRIPAKGTPIFCLKSDKNKEVE